MDMKKLILLSLISALFGSCTKQLEPDLISITKLQNENERLFQENADLKELFQGATDSLYNLRQKRVGKEVIEEKEEEQINPLGFL